MDVNITQALRYLGVQSPDAALTARMTVLAQELQSRITPRFIWRAAGMEDLRALGVMDSALAARMLRDCRQAAVLICTLGAEFDLWVQREQRRDMARAAMLDALGSAYAEAGCDAAEDAIRARFPGMHLTDRFSPGYGDLPLAVQPCLADFAGARRIGVTVTPSLLMNPQKSVTAIVGVADVPQPARVRGCDHCTMKETCNLRKAGTPCHV